MMASDNQKKVVLEVLTDRKLTEIQRSCDVLYAGKIATKKDGGFKTLYDLPPTSMLNRLKFELMIDFLRVRICHHGWLCTRNTGWIRTMCVLALSNGLLFIYTKPYKGYALKLSYAKEMKTFTSKRELVEPEKSAEVCTMKYKWDFGSLEIQLAKGQINQWRIPLLNAFEAQYPCFKTSNEVSDEKTNGFEFTTIQTSKDVQPRTDAEIPPQITFESAPQSFAETASDDSWASAVMDLDSVHTAIETNSRLEEVVLGEGGVLATSVLELKRTSETLIDAQMLSKIESDGDHLALITMKITSCEATICRPVYRLETEREKIIRQFAPIKIANKVQYFETQALDNGMAEGRNEPQLRSMDKEFEESTKITEVSPWKMALMETPF